MRPFRLQYIVNQTWQRVDRPPSKLAAFSVKPFVSMDAA
jgi:hypothetical protein